MKKLLMIISTVIMEIIFIGCAGAEAEMVVAPSNSETMIVSTVAETTTTTQTIGETSTTKETTKETTTTSTSIETSTTSVETTSVVTSPATTTYLVETTSVASSSVGPPHEKSEDQTTSPSSQNSLTYVKSFSRGTYYTAFSGAKGGSGRTLIPCSLSGEIKGSIASSYLYHSYGYNYNGKRTTLYLEINGYPQMNGYYYLDDCDAGNSNVIDFYYSTGSNCPFRTQGVVKVDCYIVN